MPMHDWNRVSAGTFHDFHGSWITHLKESLNQGLLPQDYYALSEQRTRDFSPDLLTLRATDESDHDQVKQAMVGYQIQSALQSAIETPPVVQTTQEASDEFAFHLTRQRSVVVRHASDDRMVAMMEIISPGNRHTLKAIDDFADKVIAFLERGIHVVLIDPFPSGRYDPAGIHGYIWERLLAGSYTAPIDKLLTLVSYTASTPLKAWVEPYSVEDELQSMPLFLTHDHYVALPLELTYEQAWRGVPDRWKRVIVAR
jgi:hypothetical protein